MDNAGFGCDTDVLHDLSCRSRELRISIGVSSEIVSVDDLRLSMSDLLQDMSRYLAVTNLARAKKVDGYKACDCCQVVPVSDHSQLYAAFAIPRDG